MKNCFLQGTGSVRQWLFTAERIAASECIVAAVCHEKCYIWSEGIARIFTKDCYVATFPVID